MKITVYLGANMGDNPSFKKATIALGQWIAKKWAYSSLWWQ